MAATELEKTLNRMKVTVKATELAGTPARGFTPTQRNWRVTLSKEVKDDKPLRLTLTMLSADEPTVSTVVQCLADDIEDSELSLWDFAQQYNKGKTDKSVERMHVTCKRIAPRVKRVFGDSWNKLVDRLNLAA